MKAEGGGSLDSLYEAQFPPHQGPSDRQLNDIHDAQYRQRPLQDMSKTGQIERSYIHEYTYPYAHRYTYDQTDRQTY